MIWSSHSNSLWALKKLLVLIAFSVLLLVPVGAQNTFALLCNQIPGCTTDKLYLSVESDSSVKQFSSTGGAPLNGDFATGLSGPECIAFDSAGNLYVTDFNNHRIRKITFN